MKIEMAEKGAGAGSVTRKELLKILAFRNSTEVGADEKKVRKSVAAMKDIGGVKGLLTKLGSDGKDGVSAGSVDGRKEKFGLNELEEVALPTYLELCAGAIQDPIMLMLLASATIQFILACIPVTRDPCHADAIAWQEPVVILMSVAIVVNVAAGTDYAKGKELRRMKEERKRSNTKSVYRDGKLLDIEASEIVVGDLVELTVGDIIPADGHFVQGNDMEVDESPLTGEPIAIKKSASCDDDHTNPWLIGGTKVVKGNCTFVVMAVGQFTTVGRINMQVLGRKVETDEDEEAGDMDIPDLQEESASPLESKLEKMAFDITKLGFLAAIGGAVIAAIIWLILKFGTGNIVLLKENNHGKEVLKVQGSFFSKPQCEDITIGLVYPNETDAQSWKDTHCLNFDNAQDPSKIVQLFVTAVTILVVAIPEGLPLAVTLALAVSQASMAKLNNMVKHLDACETMGSATTICSDKTGTLTKNRMTVTNVFVGDSKGGSHHKREGSTSAGNKLKKAANEKFSRAMAEGIAINSSNTSQLKPHLKADKKTIDTSRAPEQVGNKTECGFIGLCADLLPDGETYETVRKDPKFASEESPAPYGRNNACKFPFSSERKRMSWIVPNGDGFRLHCKGASEVVLARCTKILLSDTNEVVELTEEHRQSVLEHIKIFANDANRTLVTSCRDFPAGYSDWEKVYGEANAGASTIDYEAEHDLTFVGLVGIEDPLRDDVPNSIRLCFNAGVDVRMVTGDNLRTAIAIAANCGILREEHFHHLTSERKETKFAKYAERMDTHFEAMYDLQEDMQAAGISDADLRLFEADSKQARGRTLEDGSVTRDPVLCVRDNFAMEGATFAKRVAIGTVTHMGVPGEAKAESYGVKVTKEDNTNQAGIVVNQEELDIIWPKLRVMARCQPEDKLTLVQGLMESKLYSMADKVKDLDENQGITIYPDAQVVAVTGDGTNDAPALKRANVGFAMGITGTQVAQDACDIILMDDNFSSIITAIKFGRNVYESVQKFIQFQLTVNIVAVTLAIIGAIFFQASPLGAVQMLWVNLIMDSLASLALATEPPVEALLDRAPYGRNMSIISKQMYFNMFGQAFYQLIVTLIILFNGHIAFSSTEGNAEWEGNTVDGSPAVSAEVMAKQMEVFPGSPDQQIRLGWFAGCTPSQHYTMLFNCFVVMTVFNQFAARKLRGEMQFFSGIMGNRPFLLLSGVEFLLQILFVQLAGPAAGCYNLGLTGGQWGFCIMFGVIGWGWQLVLNLVGVQLGFTGGDDVLPTKKNMDSQQTIEERKGSDLVRRLSQSNRKGKTGDHGSDSKTTEHNENMVRKLSNQSS